MSSKLKWKQSRSGDDGPKYSCDYALTSRSKCKKCKQLLVKDTPRVGVWTKSPFFDGFQCSWMHPACFIAKDRKGCYGTADIAGVDDWRVQDQNLLKGHYGENLLPEEVTFREDGVHSINYYSAIEQGVVKWVVRDMYYYMYSLDDYALILSENGLKNTGGEEEKIGRITDGTLYGLLPPCPECNGKLKYNSLEYVCQGFTDWSKCQYKTSAVVRELWKLPQGLSVDYFYQWDDALRAGTVGKLLNEWQAKTSALREAEQQEQAAVVEEKARKEKAKVEEAKKMTGGTLPLKGLRFCSVGKLELGPVKMKKLVTGYGGAMATSISAKVSCLLTTPEEVAAGNPMVDAARAAGVPVVREDFLDACLIVGGWIDPTLFAINVDKARANVTVDSSRPINITEKSKSAVDDHCEVKQKVHIYEDETTGTFYDVALSMSDIHSGLNSFYLLQLLRDDDGLRWYVFLKWGRTGTDIGDTSLKRYASYDEAFAEFDRRYYDKTRNLWADRDNFVKHPNRFFPVDIEYAEDKHKEEAENTDPTLPSRLAPQIKNFVESLFDTSLLQSTLDEWNIDKNKMPLGKLKKNTVAKGYTTLKEIESVINSNSANAKVKLLDLTSKFYTLVPHDFGMKRPPVIESRDLVKEKLHMMEVLAAVECAASTMAAPSPVPFPLNPTDAHCLKLRSHVAVVPPGTEYDTISEYLHNTCTSKVRLSVEHVFKVSRLGEDAQYQKLLEEQPDARLNRQLLWHGSPTHNLIGILSQGLRVAPPDAPHTGYNYGKGVYLTDCASYAASYAKTKGAAPPPRSYLLLFEAALGKSIDAYKPAFYDKDTVAKQGGLSVRAVGTHAPDPKGAVTTSNGVVIPCGKLVRARTLYTSKLPSNEFVLYDERQVCLKYIVAVGPSN